MIGSPQTGQCGAPGAGEEQAQVVVDLGDRADRRPRVAVGRLLVDRDRGRQALDEVDVGLVHLAEELPRVRRERLDVATLALGEDRVERERRLARPGQPGEHDELVTGEIDGRRRGGCARGRPATTSRAFTAGSHVRTTDNRDICSTSSGRTPARLDVPLTAACRVHAHPVDEI